MKEDDDIKNTHLIGISMFIFVILTWLTCFVFAVNSFTKQDNKKSSEKQIQRSSENK